MSDIEAIELAEREINRLITVCHKSINYWQILKLFMVACQDLMLQSEAEYTLKQGRKNGE